MPENAKRPFSLRGTMPTRPARGAFRFAFAFFALLALGIAAASFLAIRAQSHRAKISVRRFSARAFDEKTGRLLYVEKHRERYRASKLTRSNVRYYLPDGRLIVRKALRYGADKSVPSYNFLDYRDGYHEKARRLGRVFRIRYRSRAGAAWKRVVVAPPGPLIVDAGLYFYIRKRWDSLKRGRTHTAHILVPIRKRSYLFDIRRGTSRKSGSKTIVDFIVRPRSLFIRVFAGDIRMTYDAATRGLLVYRGISPIPGLNGERGRARVVYSY